MWRGRGRADDDADDMRRDAAGSVRRARQWMRWFPFQECLAFSRGVPTMERYSRGDLEFTRGALWAGTPYTEPPTNNWDDEPDYKHPIAYDRRTGLMALRGGGKTAID